MKAVLLFCLCVTSLFSLEPPEPINGYPNFIGGGGFSTQSGKTRYAFTFPPGWGMGDMSAAEEDGQFYLFPNEGGVGCIVTVQEFRDEAAALEEMGKLKKVFRHPKPIRDGFDAVVKHARFSCYVNEQYVTQIWYPAPGKSNRGVAKDGSIWKVLRQCVAVTDEAPKVIEKEWVAVEEITSKGWLCHHPNGKLHVLYKTNPGSPARPNQGMMTSLLKISESSGGSSGFFYIKWDQVDTHTQDVYKSYLDEIKEEVLSFEEGQQFEQSPIFQENFAYLKGNPYSILIVSGEEFLFAFAVKSDQGVHPIDFDGYVQRVEWWEDR